MSTPREIPASRKRCGKCEGCHREDCGHCLECVHKKKFGGDGSSKQACLTRKCLIIKDPKPKITNFPRNPKSICMPKKKRKASGPRMIHLFHLPPSPTNLHSTEDQIDPDLSAEHTGWCNAVNPENTYPVSALESFYARSGPRPAKAADKEDSEEEEEEEDVSESSEAESFVAAVLSATPAVRFSNQQQQATSSPRRSSSRAAAAAAAAKEVTDEGEDSADTDEANDNHSESESTDEGEEEEALSEEELSDMDEPQPKRGKWSTDQELLFRYGLRKYGKGKWREITALVPNRNATQIKSHGQKVLLKKAQGEDIFQMLKDDKRRLKLLLARARSVDSSDEEDSETEEEKSEEEVSESDGAMEEVGDIDSGSDSERREADSISESSDPEEDVLSYRISAKGGSQTGSRGMPVTPPTATRDGDDVFFECLPEVELVKSHGDNKTLTSASMPRARRRETDAARDARVSNFFEMQELADQRALLSDYNKLLLQHVELCRAKENDVACGRGKISLNSLGWRCRMCGAAGNKQRYSQSFPGRPDVMEFNLYIIASKHLMGADGQPCPFVGAEVRGAIKAAQATTRFQTRERGGGGVKELFNSLMPLVGIKQTMKGMKLKDDIRANDLPGVPTSTKRRREHGVVSTKPSKKNRKAKPIIPSKPVPSKPKRAPASVIETALRGPRKAPVQATHASMSRAVRRVLSRTKESHVGIDEDIKMRRLHVGTKSFTGGAVDAISSTFNAHLESVFSNVAGLKTTGLYEEAAVREFPDARLTVETEQALKSKDLECQDCHFPLLADRFQLFPLADLVLLQKRQKQGLCEKCKSHLATAKDFHVQQRERKLVDPWNPMVFPNPVFRIGGVSEEFMSYFLSLKFRLTASKARMKDFGRIPATGGQGKFQYLVGDKSVSERRWQWQDCKLLQNAPLETRAIEQFALAHVATQLPLGIDGYRIDPGFVMTHKAVVQGPHRDFTGYESLYNEIYEGLGGELQEPNFSKSETAFLPWVLHCPLCKEGMELNYWPETRKNQPPVRIHIPFGTFLLSRVDAVHGGIFGSQGNIRLHIAYTPLADAIAIKGKELQMVATDDRPSEGDIQRHIDLGATQSGQHQRKLDLLKDDIGEYRDPKGVDDCERGYPIAFEEPTYAQRLAKRNAAVWDSTIMDNISAEHLFLGK